MTQAEYDYYCEHFFDCEDNDDFHNWSEAEYWEREARLGAQWYIEDHGYCPCNGSGYLLTNIDTYTPCGCGGNVDSEEDDGWPTMTVEQWLNNN